MLETPKKTIRCAIYTRKSTDEGLELDFNSLEAQREAAEAYIASQRHEGWVCLPERYDDGGYSGGTINRPGLRNLLADMEAGRIDCVVVYKVDRLSRSLLDFTRLMETFEKRSISFVSVTQQLNTTSSMGRLTLNILLSFAQFEREIGAERVRDKVRAAKRKGKWMGGVPVLGYDVPPEGRRIVINNVEAAQVREIYRLYLKHEALMPVIHELAAKGWCNKRWTTRKGDIRGGRPFGKTPLHRLLTNPLYKGELTVGSERYPGEHEAIIPAETWDRVQAVLHRNCTHGAPDPRNKHNALLKGLLFCESCGTAMISTYSMKGNKRYRYYVCLHAHQRGWDACPTKSLNAHAIETAVLEQIRDVGSNPGMLDAVMRQLEEERAARQTELHVELQVTRRELQSHKERMAALATNGAPDMTTADFVSGQMAKTELKIRALTDTLEVLEAETLAAEDIRRDLHSFTPLWDALPPDDRARLVRLMVEKVLYNGATANVSMVFRPEGMRAMGRELASLGESL